MSSPGGGRNVILKLVGVGSGGCRVVDSVRVSGVPGAGRVLIDCDRTVLTSLRARKPMLVGREICNGLGSGGRVDATSRAIERSMKDVMSAICPADAAFVVACMGKGFGSGAAEVVCREVRKTGCFVVMVAVQPFEFEGPGVLERAVECTRAANSSADCVVVVPNSVSARGVGERLALERLIGKINEFTGEALRALACLLVRRRAMSIGLSEVRAKLGGCYAALGYGKATGSRPILKAFTSAITSSLLVQEDCEAASGFLVSIASKKKLQLDEIREACDFIGMRLGAGNVDFGFSSDPELGRGVSVTVLAGSERFPYGWLSSELRHLVTGRAGAPRGAFAETAPTLYEGEDLDVPTFLRHPELMEGGTGSRGRVGGC